MNPIKPDEILSIPALNFKPLSLCLDDVLPVSMVLLMGFNYRINPVELRRALQITLQAFPHLSGRIQVSLQPFHAELVPAENDIHIEWIRNGQSLSTSIESSESSQVTGSSALQILETLDQETLYLRFAPSAANVSPALIQALQAPLLQLRLTWIPEQNICVLGVMASHIALDGIGLAFFLNHLSSAIFGRNAHEVIHDRHCTFPHTPILNGLFPSQYREVPNLLTIAQDQDPHASSHATVFSIMLDDLHHHVGNSSSADSRFFLAAHLCQVAAGLQPGRNTLALWCNSRGLGHVPRHYTGNTGCYVHFPLKSGDANGCYQHLKSTITRKGFAEITDTYARLKSAEAAGRYAFWIGPQDNLLSLNLVPHIRPAVDSAKVDPTMLNF